MKAFTLPNVNYAPPPPGTIVPTLSDVELLYIALVGAAFVGPAVQLVNLAFDWFRKPADAALRASLGPALGRAASGTCLRELCSAFPSLYPLNTYSGYHKRAFTELYCVSAFA